MGGRPQRCSTMNYKCHHCYASLCLAVQSYISFHVPNQSESCQLELRPSTSMTTMMTMRQGTFEGFPWLCWPVCFSLITRRSFGCNESGSKGWWIVNSITNTFSFMLWGCDLCGARHKSTCGTLGPCSRQKSKSIKLQYLFLEKTGTRLTSRVDKKGISSPCEPPRPTEHILHPQGMLPVPVGLRFQHPPKSLTMAFNFVIKDGVGQQVTLPDGLNPQQPVPLYMGGQSSSRLHPIPTHNPPHSKIHLQHHPSLNMRDAKSFSFSS